MVSAEASRQRANHNQPQGWRSTTLASRQAATSRMAGPTSLARFAVPASVLALPPRLTLACGFECRTAVSALSRVPLDHPTTMRTGCCVRVHAGGRLAKEHEEDGPNNDTD